MRWQQLFADLGGQLEQAELAAERGEAGSRARAEVGGLLLADRLRGALGSPVVLQVRGAGRTAGVLFDAGPDWLLLADEAGHDVLVAARALTSVAGLGRRTAPAAPGPVLGRLDLRRALRALARDRATVQLVLDDGSVAFGTVDRVGADYLDLAEHPADAPRRAEAVRGVRAVVLGAVAVVRTVLPGG
jgi:hypothetical protein